VKWITSNYCVICKYCVDGWWTERPLLPLKQTNTHWRNIYILIDWLMDGPYGLWHSDCLWYIVYSCSALPPPNHMLLMKCSSLASDSALVPGQLRLLKIYFKISTPTNLKSLKCKWDEKWQEKRKYSEKTCPSVILYNTNIMWPDLEWNAGHHHHGGKPVINCTAWANSDSNIYITHSWE
jgi:hypothetical protein